MDRSGKKLDGMQVFYIGLGVGEEIKLGCWVVGLLGWVADVDGGKTPGWLTSRKLFYHPCSVIQERGQE